MNITVIHCSPRKGGNSETLLMDLLNNFKTPEHVIHINQLNISGCTGCMACRKTGLCVINDDMNQLYRVFDETELLILSTPVYFNSLPSQAKAMVDRCQIYWSRHFALNQEKTKMKKRIVTLSTSGSSSDRAKEGLASTLELFYVSIDGKLLQHFHLSGLDELKEMRLKEVLSGSDFDNQDTLQTHGELGKRIWTLKRNWLKEISPVLHNN